MKRPTQWLIAPALLAVLLALVVCGRPRPDHLRPRPHDTQPRATLPATPAGLDRTGSTVPTTNYPIPAGAVFMSPQGRTSTPEPGRRRCGP